MIDLIDLLPVTPNHNEDPTYLDEEVRKRATHVFALAGNGLLAVLTDEEEFFVSFVVFGFCSSEADGSGILWQRVFDGSGPSGNLRELRHTCWGEADNHGYIFYPDGNLIADAFNKLDRWFDR